MKFRTSLMLPSYLQERYSRRRKRRGRVEAIALRPVGFGGVESPVGPWVGSRGDHGICLSRRVVGSAKCKSLTSLAVRKPSDGYGKPRA